MTGREHQEKTLKQKCKGSVNLSLGKGKEFSTPLQFFSKK